MLPPPTGRGAVSGAASARLLEKGLAYGDAEHAHGASRARAEEEVEAQKEGKTRAARDARRALPGGALAMVWAREPPDPDDRRAGGWR